MDKTNMIDVIQALAIQILFYASIASIVADGAKKAIKIVLNMKEEQKLNRFISLGLILVFGISSSFLLQSELIVNTAVGLAFGLIIALSTLVVYKSVLKGLLTVIPALFKKIAG